MCKKNRRFRMLLLFLLIQDTLDLFVFGLVWASMVVANCVGFIERVA
jgi:hypothetical protein